MRRLHVPANGTFAKSHSPAGQRPSFRTSLSKDWDRGLTRTKRDNNRVTIFTIDGHRVAVLDFSFDQQF